MSGRFLLGLLAVATFVACGEETSQSTTSAGPGVGGGNQGPGGQGPGGQGPGGSGGSGAAGGGGAGPTVRFATIGDYGTDDGDEQDVSDLVKGWSPDFVITLGDNNYPDGEAATIDVNIGQYYAELIGDYVGNFGPGSATNRFWPSPGNHDWHAPNLQPYLDYFTLPGNERYYDVDLGVVHLYAIDSDGDEPDGNDAQSVQAAWLQDRLARSTSCWDVVYFHHAAYSSSSEHGSDDTLQWPYEEWGAEVVMGGHDHTYERLQIGGIPYFVNGLGGAGIYDLGTPLPESQFAYNDMHGAMLVTATNAAITYQFISVDGAVQDEHTVTKDCP
jgi:hypothetical protein